jgi:hypothetical protein
LTTKQKFTLSENYKLNLGERVCIILTQIVILLTFEKAFKNRKTKNNQLKSGFARLPIL